MSRRYSANEIGLLTDCDGVDHDSDLSNTPTHDKGAYAEVLLEGRAKDDEPANIQRHSDVACPTEYRQCLFHSSSILNTKAYQRRDSAMKTPLLRRIEKFMTQSLKYRPSSSPIRTATCKTCQRVP